VNAQLGIGSLNLAGTQKPFGKEYMDSHKREDVVKYQQEIFLPVMQQYERQMVHFEGPELCRVEPELALGEK
jgi:hypothetical protein